MESTLLPLFHVSQNTFVWFPKESIKVLDSPEITPEQPRDEKRDDELEKLMNKSWSEMTNEERNSVIQKMGNPSPTEYRKFHSEMAKKAPEDSTFVVKYREVANMSSQKGRSTGKALGMRQLCHQWILAKEEA